jgi:pimeloyl-ACP methyl ester carboxylesterase
MASFGLKVTRLGFGVASRLLPERTARIAYCLFCRTDGRKPKGAKAAKVHAEGLRILAKAEQTRLAVTDGSVTTHRFRAGSEAAPRVLVVHGWGSQAVYLARMAEGLSAKGLDVTVLDLPGHGLSSGRTLDIRRAVEALLAASRQAGGFDAIVGHSFGGAATLTAVSGLLSCFPAVKTERLVLIGAPSRLDFIFEGFARVVGLSRDMLQRLEAEAEKVTGVHPARFDGVTLAMKANVPLLVIHAEDDKEVPAENARRYEGASDKIAVSWANGLGHRRIVSDNGVIATIGDFVMRKNGAENVSAPRSSVA